MAVEPLDAQALPRLALLECTFTEAAAAIVPGRPVTHVKTCISRADLNGKKAEISQLFTKLSLSKRRVRSLDLSDESYTEEASQEILEGVVGATHRLSELRFLGTLVLPIGGQERLKFYGLLMRLHRLRCVELEVTDWDPPPVSAGAFRALANELRLYCRKVKCVVFVQEDDRTVMGLQSGHWEVDAETNTDTLWREL